MARKAKNKIIEESLFVDDVSDIKYHWLKEETDRENDISCWLAEDAWGNKDHFVVKMEEGKEYPSKVLRGPFRTIKETLESLENKEEEENPVVENEDGRGYINAGLLDDLYQLINLETENIRKCQELMCRADDADKKGFVEIISKIIEAANSNIGMLNAMTNSLSPTPSAMEDGSKEAEAILSDDVFDFKDDIEDNTDANVVSAFEDGEISNIQAINDRFAMDSLDDEDLKRLNF